MKSNPKIESEVRIALESLHDTFGGKSYSETQIEIILESAILYGKDNFLRVVRKFMEERSSKPYPMDFKTQLRNLPQDLKPQQQTPEYQIQCEYCMDTGKVFFDTDFVEHSGKPVVAYCKCPKGYSEFQELPNLPLIDLSQFGYIVPFPTHCFVNTSKPGESERKIERDFMGENKHIIDWWNDIKQNSAQYWQKQNGTKEHQ